MAKKDFTKATKSRSITDLIDVGDDLKPLFSEDNKEDLVKPERKKKIEEALGDRIVEISTNKLSAHRHHTFKVLNNEDMDTLVESIREFGVIMPLIVRKTDADTYEIISGHRRKHAAEIAGLKTVPCIVTDIDDDTSDIYMVDSNAQREKILPSEKAKSYKVKYDAMKRQGKRTDLEDDISEENEDSFLEAVANGEEHSGRQIQRFIRLAGLNENLLDLIDDDIIGTTAGYILSFLSPTNQSAIVEAFSEKHYSKMSGKQAEDIRKVGKSNITLTPEMVHDVMSGKKKGRAANKTEKSKLNEKAMKDYYHDRIKTASPEKKLEYAKAAFMYFNEFLDAHPEELIKYEGDIETTIEN